MSNVSYNSRSSSVTHIPLDEFLTQIKSTRDSTTNFKGMIDAASATTSSPSSYFKTWKIKSTDFHMIVVLEFWRENLMFVPTEIGRP